MREIAVTPCRVCFQCGMVNHPQPGDTIRVSNVTSKYDCRAYRVFRCFIKRAIRKMRGRMPENADRADADKEVFLCEPHPNGGCNGPEITETAPVTVSDSRGIEPLRDGQAHRSSLRISPAPAGDGERGMGGVATEDRGRTREARAGLLVL